MIEIRDLTVRKNERVICWVPELHVTPGEHVAILGANGCGKTTLLRALAGIETEIAGRCRLSVPRADRVFVHQVPYLFRGTVAFNVMYGLRIRSLTRAACERQAAEWLERFGIQSRMRENVAVLSGGERRRVALARAMAVRPKLLLLDEPFSDMDSTGVAAVISAIEELQETTVLIASPSKLPEHLVVRELKLAAKD